MMNKSLALCQIIEDLSYQLLKTGSLNSSDLLKITKMY